MKPLFTQEELKIFFEELWSKFRSGVRSPEGVVYIAVTLIGVAWASWGIPSINNSETSPETLGIYVIGFLIAVALDSAMIAWKHKNSSSSYEIAILTIIGLTSFVMIFLASNFAIRPVDLELKPPQRVGWKPGSMELLGLFLSIAILMSLIVSGIDTGRPSIGPLDNPVSEIADRNANG